MDVTEYNIFRITTRSVRNSWNEEIFTLGKVVHCIMDMKSLWLARPAGSKITPRMLPKDECRELTDEEKQKYIDVNLTD